jgi:hypothetical protein
MEYKRLTERRGKLVIDKCGNCENVRNPQGCTGTMCYEIMKNRLAELEDKIEQGKMIELPCKVGDTVYQVCEKPSTNCFVLLKKEFFIVEHKIGDIKMSMVGAKPIFAIMTFNREWGVMSWNGEHINTRLFLTREEAEKRLKELQE